MFPKNYRYKDLDMLIASQSVIENFKIYISELSSIRPEYNATFMHTLSEKVNSGFEYYLGLGTTRELQRIKFTLNSVQAQSLRAIAFLKTLIELRTGNNITRKKQIFETLGFEKYLKAVQNNDTIALLELLSTIRNKMNSSLKKELIKNKSDAEFIERISEYANKLKKINRSKESLNATRKAIEEEAQRLFNEIYTSIIGICKTVSRYYVNDSDKRELFVFSKVVNRIKHSIPVS